MTALSHVSIPTKILLGAAVVALAGCANYKDIGSDKKPRDINTLEASQTLRAPTGEGSGHEWPRQGWWTPFGDAQLDALIEEALANSPSLETAAARLAAARAATGTARSGLYPSVDASLDIQYQRFTENGIIPPPYGGAFDSNNTLQLNFGYDLDFWGKHHAEVAAAVSQEKAAEAEHESARLMLTSAVAKTYVELQRLFMLREVTEKTLQQRQQIFNLTQQRVDSGLDTRAELKQAEAQLPALRGQIAQIDETIGSVRNALAALLGAGPDRGARIQEPKLAKQAGLAQLPANLPVDLLGRRPDVVAARWRVEAAERNTDVAKDLFYPNVNLTAFVGYSSLGLDQLTRQGSHVYGIGPAVRLPIFAGGKLRANLRSQYAAYDNAVATYNQTLTDALHDVADQMNALKWLEVRQREQASALQVARDALDLATQRYQAGLGNYLSVLNAETLVLEQEQLGTALDARALDLRVNLIKALGGGFDAQTQTAQAAR